MHLFDRIVVFHVLIIVIHGNSDNKLEKAIQEFFRSLQGTWNNDMFKFNFTLKNTDFIEPDQRSGRCELKWTHGDQSNSILLSLVCDHETKVAKPIENTPKPQGKTINSRNVSADLCFIVSCKSDGKTFHERQCCNESMNGVRTNGEHAVYTFNVPSKDDEWNCDIVEDKSDSIHMAYIDDGSNNTRMFLHYVNAHIHSVNYTINMKYFDFHANGNVIYSNSTFCFDWLRYYKYAVVQCLKNNKNYCIKRIDCVSESSCLSGSNDTDILILETTKRIEQIVCIPESDTIAFSIFNRNYSLYYLTTVSELNGSNPASVIDTLNSYPLTSKAISDSYHKPIYPMENNFEPQLLIVTKVGICLFNLFTQNCSETLLPKELYPTEIENIEFIAGINDMLYIYENSLLRKYNFTDYMNSKTMTVSQDFTELTATTRTTDLKIRSNPDVNIRLKNCCCTIEWRNDSLLYTCNRNDSNLDNVNYDLNSTNNIYDNISDGCNYIHDLALIFNVSCHAPGNEMTRNENCAKVYKGRSPSVIHSGIDFKEPYVLDIKIKPLACVRCESLSFSYNVSYNPNLDDNIWLIGAIGILLILVFVQVVWLQRGKLISESFSKVLDQIKHSDIKWMHHLDSGFFGEVWLGEMKDTLSNVWIPVALKQSHSRVEIGILIQEALLLKDLKHINIIDFKGLYVNSIDDDVYEESTVVLIFEYLNGGSCKNHFIENCNRVTMTDIKQIIIDIVEACNYLESHGYLHRDIAARNILLKINDITYKVEKAKLADFGMAKHVHGEDTKYQNTHCMIPPRIAAPEVLANGEFTPKSDVWAFGVFIWELFTIWQTCKEAIPYEHIPEINLLPYYICIQRDILDKPVKCPDNIYHQVLIRAWAYGVEERVSFRELKYILSGIQWMDSGASMLSNGHTSIIDTIGTIGTIDRSREIRLKKVTPSRVYGGAKLSSASIKTNGSNSSGCPCSSQQSTIQNLAFTDSDSDLTSPHRISYRKKFQKINQPNNAIMGVSNSFSKKPLKNFPHMATADMKLPETHRLTNDIENNWPVHRDAMVESLAYTTDDDGGSSSARVIGPGIAIRILCRTEPYICRDFNETQNVLKIITRFSRYVEEKTSAVLKVKDCLSPEDSEKLYICTSHVEFSSTLLPVQTVGVQGDLRSYSYAAALSTDHRPYPWNELFFLTRIITHVVHKINRVTFVFGESVKHPIQDVTPTLLTSTPIALIREADNIATTVLTKHNAMNQISQMPVVLLPLHFDRPPSNSELPSVLYSVCLRPFVTNDFMTGMAAKPDFHIKTAVLDEIVRQITTELRLVSRVLLDLTSKPPGTTEWE